MSGRAPVPILPPGAGNLLAGLLALGVAALTAWGASGPGDPGLLAGLWVVCAIQVVSAVVNVGIWLRRRRR